MSILILPTAMKCYVMNKTFSEVCFITIVGDRKHLPTHLQHAHTFCRKRKRGAGEKNRNKKTMYEKKRQKQVNKNEKVLCVYY